MGKSAQKDQQNPLREVKSLLVSQPKPSDPNSPYYELARKYDLKIDFRPFIQVDPVDVREFRRQKINILDFTAVIFTSRNAIDHFFTLAKQLRIEVPADMKYFCVSDQTANYLQKYIVVRKRKVFVGQKTAKDLTAVIKKHKTEKYLFPCSSIRKGDIPDFLNTNKIKFAEAVIYETVASDLSDLSDVNYDMIAFFSPSGVHSLFTNFPEFKQNNTRIAAFGPTTAKAVSDKDLHLDVEAPMPNAPSMTGAIELYIKKANNIE